MADRRLRAPASGSPAAKLLTVAIGVALSGLWALSLGALTALLTPQGWWGSAVAISAVVTLLACLGRAATRTPRWLVLTVAGAAGFALWIARFAGSGRLREWISAPAEQASRLQGEVLRGVAPLDPTPLLQDVVLLLVWAWSLIVVAVLAAFGRRRSGVPGVPGALAAALLVALPPLFVPLLTNESPRTGVLVGMVTLVALITWLASARVNLFGAAAAGCAVALAAGAFALVPEVRAPSGNRGVQFAPVGEYVDDVTIELARDLRAGSTTPVLTYTSDQEQAMYIRLATLSTFDGGTWLPDDAPDAAGLTVGEERVLVSPNGEGAVAELAALQQLSNGQRDEQGRIFIETPAGAAWFSPSSGRLIGIQSAVSARGDFTLEYNENERFVANVSIAALRSSWLPLPNGATQVGTDRAGAFDPGAWAWTAQASTAMSNGGMTKRGDNYRVSLDPWSSSPTRLLPGWLPPELLRVFPTPEDAPSGLRPYLELPGALPPSLAGLTSALSGSDLDRIDIAFRLEQYFRQSGQFTYDEAAPYLPGADPDSPYGVMDAFLTTKTGYCVHFATTFATIARSLGVPTRVAVGYASRARGDTRVVVRGKELHAWPEIYVDTVGWVPFEPTPGGAGFRAEVGGASSQDAEEAAAREAPASAETDGEEVAAAEELAGEMSPLTDEELARTQDPEAAEAASAGGGAPWVATGVALLAAFLLLAAAPLLLRTLRRALRVRAIRSGVDPARAAWAEFVAVLRDYRRAPGQGAVGASVPRAQTPEALVAALRANGALLTEEARAAADRLASAVSRERYAPARQQTSARQQVPAKQQQPARQQVPALQHSCAQPAGEEAAQLIADLDTVRAELRSGSSWKGRARARWIPASVLR